MNKKYLLSQIKLGIDEIYRLLGNCMNKIITISSERLTYVKGMVILFNKFLETEIISYNELIIRGYNGTEYSSSALKAFNTFITLFVLLTPLVPIIGPIVGVYNGFMANFGNKFVNNLIDKYNIDNEVKVYLNKIIDQNKKKTTENKKKTNEKKIFTRFFNTIGMKNESAKNESAKNENENESVKDIVNPQWEDCPTELLFDNPRWRDHLYDAGNKIIEKLISEIDDKYDRYLFFIKTNNDVFKLICPSKSSEPSNRSKSSIDDSTDDKEFQRINSDIIMIQEKEAEKELTVPGRLDNINSVYIGEPTSTYKYGIPGCIAHKNNDDTYAIKNISDHAEKLLEKQGIDINSVKEDELKPRNIDAKNTKKCDPRTNPAPDLMNPTQVIQAKTSNKSEKNTSIKQSEITKKAEEEEKLEEVCNSPLAEGTEVWFNGYKGYFIENVKKINGSYKYDIKTQAKNASLIQDVSRGPIRGQIKQHIRGKDDSKIYCGGSKKNKSRKLQKSKKSKSRKNK
jgi:hypothetical protein